MAAKQPRFQIELNRSEIARLKRRVTHTGAKAAATIARDRARQNIARKGRVNTGAMMRKVNVREVLRSDDKSIFEVIAEAEYSGYQEEGIGPVYPVRAKFLRFKPKGKSTFVFAKKTRGFKGAHFMRDAMRAVKLSDFMP